MYGREYRLGRCPNCSIRPAFAWLASTGLRLEDVRCPRCDYPLQLTSRMVYNVRSLTDDEVVDALRSAEARAFELHKDHCEMVEAWERDLTAVRTTNGDSMEEYKARLNRDRYAEAAEHQRKRLARLRKGLAKLQTA